MYPIAIRLVFAHSRSQVAPAQPFARSVRQLALDSGQSLEPLAVQLLALLSSRLPVLSAAVLREDWRAQRKALFSASSWQTRLKPLESSQPPQSR